MKPIELPILFHTEETRDLQKLGIECDEIDCKIRNQTFFNIEFISVRLANEKHSIVGCNGDEFVCVLNYETLKQKLLHENI